MPKVNDLFNEKVERYITSLIDEGALADGDRLPSERELARKFNTSNSPVRQATQVLVDNGMLERIPGKGTYIRTADFARVKTHRIGVLYPHWDHGFFTSAYFSAILNGIQFAARKENKVLLFESLVLEGGKGQPSNAIRKIGDDVDGIIIVDFTPDLLVYYQRVINKYSKPVVVVGYEGIKDDQDVVISDGVENAKHMVSMLVKAGHARIACLAQKGFSMNRHKHPNIINRINGYKLGLLEAGLPVDEQLVGIQESVQDFDTFKRLVEGPNPPTALFCVSDRVALNALKLGRKLSMKVPEDISIVGYGDAPDSQHSYPQLTTVHLPLMQMGQAAVKRLIEKDQNDTESFRMVFPGTIIKRDSHRELSL